MLADGSESETLPTANKMHCGASRCTHYANTFRSKGRLPSPGYPTAGRNGPKPGILDELYAMREMMEDRFSALAWLGQARQDPIQANLMLC